MSATDPAAGDWGSGLVETAAAAPSWGLVARRARARRWSWAMRLYTAPPTAGLAETPPGEATGGVADGPIALLSR